MMAGATPPEREIAGECEPGSSNATASPFLNAASTFPLSQLDAVVFQKLFTPSPRHVRLDCGGGGAAAMFVTTDTSAPLKAVAAAGGVAGVTQTVIVAPSL